MNTTTIAPADVFRVVAETLAANPPTVGVYVHFTPSLSWGDWAQVSVHGDDQTTVGALIAALGVSGEAYYADWQGDESLRTFVRKWGTELRLELVNYTDAEVLA